MRELDMVAATRTTGQRQRSVARLAHLVCETAKRLTNPDHAPVRDNKGLRARKGHVGRLAK